MTKQTQSSVQVIPFNGFAKTLMGAKRKFDKASESLRDVKEVTIRQYVDLCAQTNGRTEDSAKALQKAIMESEVVQTSIALGTEEKKTWTEYALGAARALYFNVQWTASLKNDPQYALPWGKGAKKGASSGKTRTTDDKALVTTLQKAMQQARLLKKEWAPDLLDSIQEFIPDFEEAKAE